MRPNSVFVSHSSKTTLAFTEAVVAALKARGLEPLWDKDEIRGGDQWRERISDLLAECHAAVILFSPEALESQWVLYEASILSWRRRRDDNFKLVPVLLGGVQRKAIQEKGFAPLVLTELQALKENPNTPKEIAALLPAQGQFCSQQTPLERVTAEIADHIGQSVPGSRIRRAAEVHGITISWSPQQDQLEAITEEIARHMFRDGVDGLPKWLQALNTIDRATAKKLLEFLAPFWVPIESAGQLVELAPKRASAGINGKPNLARWTGQMFVRRAWWPSRDELFVDPGVAFDQGVKQQIIDRIRENLLNTGQFEFATEVDEYLENPKPPLYVLLRRIDPATLAELQKDYANVHFLVHAGESLDRLEQAPYSNLALLRPPLDLDVEQRAREAYRAVSLILNPPGGQRDVDKEIRREIHPQTFHTFR